MTYLAGIRIKREKTSEGAGTESVLRKVNSILHSCPGPCLLSPLCFHSPWAEFWAQTPCPGLQEACDLGPASCNLTLHSSPPSSYACRQPGVFPNARRVLGSNPVPLHSRAMLSVEYILLVSVCTVYLFQFFSFQLYI